MMEKTARTPRLGGSLCAVCLVISLLCASEADVQAGEILQQVKASGVVRCSGVARPGLAERDGSGHWKGLEVDVCRAVAAAVLGSQERVKFTDWEPGPNDRGRAASDILFLTGAEMAESGFAGGLVPGPAIYIESHAILVPEDSKVQEISGLSGQDICFMTGSRIERSLEASFDLKKRDWLRRPFSEEEEMMDAYQARNCRAVAGERTCLAAIRQEQGLDHQKSRILPGSLEDFPVMAATEVRDGQWAAIVAWTVHTLISGEMQRTPWTPGGDEAMPVDALELGVGKGWQSRVLKAVGSYRDIYDRNLGHKSPLALEPALNASHADGGMLLSPFLE